MEKSTKPNYLDILYIAIRDVLKNWLVIISIAFLLSVLAGMVAAETYEPIYVSRCTMIVSAKDSGIGTYGNTKETQRLTDTIKAVMDNSILKQQVAEELDMKKFDATLSINVLADTNLLEVSVSSDTPYSSFMLLNTLLDMFPEFSVDTLPDIVLDVFEDPNFPSAPSNPPNFTRMRTAVFFISAAVLFIIMLLFFIYQDTVKNERDASEKLDAKLLGVLYHEHPYRNIKAFVLRKKKRMLMTAPAVSFGFGETIKKIRTNLIYFCDKHEGNVALVTSYGKKEGKSTIAANLAFSLAQRNKRVLLISGKASEDVLPEILGLQLPEDTDTVSDIEDMIYTKENSYLSLMNNPEKNPLGISFSEFISSDEFSRFMQDAREEYDYIIIDGPCTKNSADTEILAKLSDFSLLVVKQNQSKIPFINDTIDLLNRYSQGLAGCVFNDVYSSSSVINIGYGYGYGYGGYSYGSYGRYGKYGKYSRYGGYGKYGAYGRYGAYGKHRSSKSSQDRAKHYTKRDSK